MCTAVYMKESESSNKKYESRSPVLNIDMYFNNETIKLAEQKTENVIS